MLLPMTAWLLKTEPGAYSYEDLQRDGTTHWDGVTNAMAQLNMRAMQLDDPVVIYHSQTTRRPSAWAGRAGALPRPDRRAGQAGVGRRQRRAATHPAVTLTELKADPVFASSMLVRQSRLSVVRLDDEQLASIERRAGEPST
jgi:predicted RNA-binding protein with PUA-like domain